MNACYIHYNNYYILTAVVIAPVPVSQVQVTG